MAGRWLLPLPAIGDVPELDVLPLTRVIWPVAVFITKMFDPCMLVVAGVVRLEALDSKATIWPLELMEAWVLSPLAAPPPAACVIIVV